MYKVSICLFKISIIVSGVFLTRSDGLSLRGDAVPEAISMRFFASLNASTAFAIAQNDISEGVRNDKNPQFERRVDVEKGQVAFVELRSPDPLTVYIMYPTQYTKYNTTGSLEGVLELKNITWLLYPLPAMLEDQTVYFVPEREVRGEAQGRNGNGGGGRGQRYQANPAYPWP